LTRNPQLFQLYILLQLTKEVHIKNLSSKLKAEKQETSRYVRNQEIQYLKSRFLIGKGEQGSERSIDEAKG